MDDSQKNPPAEGRPELYAKILGLQIWVAALILFLLALPLFYLQAKLKEPWSTVFGGLASTLAPVALLTLIYEIWLRRTAAAETQAAAEQAWHASGQASVHQFSEAIEQLLPKALEQNRDQLIARLLDGVALSANLQAVGIREVANFGAIRWQGFFDSDGDIDICVSYAETWARTNAWLAVKSAAEHHRRVRVTLLDPNGPNDLLAFYASMYGAADVTELQRRIEAVRTIWREQVARLEGGGTSARVAIEGIRRHFPYTFYSCGDLMWLVMAPRRAGRQPPEQIPAVLCARTGTVKGLFDWASEDVEACRRDGDIVQLEEIGHE